MDMSTLKSMQDAAVAIGSATKYIGAANLELGKVALPAMKSAVGNVPKLVEKTFDQARHGSSNEERRHAAAVIGVGVVVVSALSRLLPTSPIRFASRVPYVLKNARLLLPLRARSR